MLTSVALLVFPALMAYAAASDLLTMTLANWISLALLGAFVPLALAAGLGPERIAVDHLSCGAAVLALTFALFARGWIGGGDAKLAAATAVWLGWEHAAEYGLATALYGGVLALAVLGLRRLPLPPSISFIGWVDRLRAPDSGVPYGIALAAAGLLLYPQSAVWTAVA